MKRKKNESMRYVRFKGYNGPIDGPVLDFKVFLVSEFAKILAEYQLVFNVINSRNEMNFQMIETLITPIENSLHFFVKISQEYETKNWIRKNLEEKAELERRLFSLGNSIQIVFKNSDDLVGGVKLKKLMGIEAGSNQKSVYFATLVNHYGEVTNAFNVYFNLKEASFF